jgi:ATP-dependent DNA ligase
MPGFIKPQLAILKTKAPQGDQWLHEIKYDGYRVQVHVNSGGRRSTPATDWTGLNGSLLLLARSIFRVKPSSMAKWS